MLRLFKLIILLLSVLLAACSGTAVPAATSAANESSADNPLAGVPTPSLAPEPTDTTVAVATAVPTDTPIPATATPEAPTVTATAAPTTEPVKEVVTIAGAGGLQLQGIFLHTSETAPQPGVILLHMYRSDRQAWLESGLPDALVENGYRVLALDMRGHGETGGVDDWELARVDLQRAWTWMTAREDVEAARTAVVGASIGANMALRLGVDRPEIQTIVLLSPGQDYFGVTTNDQVVLFGERPLLIVASEEDSYAAESSRILADLAQGESRLEMYTGAGHGTQMFRAKPELQTLILAWLNQQLAVE